MATRNFCYKQTTKKSKLGYTYIVDLYEVVGWELKSFNKKLLEKDQKTNKTIQGYPIKLWKDWKLEIFQGSGTGDMIVKFILTDKVWPSFGFKSL